MKNLISSLLIILGVVSGSLTSFLISPTLSTDTTIQRIATTIQSHNLPNQLSIPTLGISVSVEYVGKDATGRMDVPKDTNNAGWYDLGPWPGAKGSAVIAGHYDSLTGPAIFFNLSKLQLNDEVIVTTKKGEELTFVVTRKEVYPDSEFPVEEVFGPSDEVDLNLITCGGVFDKQAKNYSDRIVVFTTLKE